jgi:hypothetical protein
LGEEFLLKKVTSHTPENRAENSTVLREGTPVPLIVADGFTAEEAKPGQTITFVLAHDFDNLNWAHSII